MTALMADVHASEDGVTLVELLVSITIFMLVLGAVLGVLTATSRGVTDDAVRTQSTMDAQSGIARMVRELRAAYAVVDMGPNLMDFDARINGQYLRVQYDCSVAYPDDPANPYDQTYRRCMRKAATVTDVTSPDQPVLPATGSVIVDRLCAGASAATCDPPTVFTCRSSASTPTPCLGVDPPVDPDNPPDPGEDITKIYPTLVEINVQVPARGATKSPVGSRRISLNDGVFLENVATSYDVTS